MRCPFCGENEDKVLETRIQKDGEYIRRRRECLKCSSRFSTQEVLIVSLPSVVKKDGRTESFNKQKILHGVMLACSKRPIGKTKVDAVVDSVCKWALKLGAKEIPASLIGARVLHELKALDQVAYVRFASVHRSFTNLNEFLSNLGTNLTPENSDNSQMNPKA